MTSESLISLWTGGNVFRRHFDTTSLQKNNRSRICDLPNHVFLSLLIVPGMMSSLCGLALKSNYKAVGNFHNTMPLLLLGRSLFWLSRFTGGSDSSWLLSLINPQGTFWHYETQQLWRKLSGQYQLGFSVPSDYTSFHLCLIALTVAGTVLFPFFSFPLAIFLRYSNTKGQSHTAYFLSIPTFSN